MKTKSYPRTFLKQGAALGGGVLLLGLESARTYTGRKQIQREARDWERATAILARFLSPGEESS